MWVAIYLYLMGAALMWWWARAQAADMGGKIVAAVAWPLLVPFVALFK